MKNRKFTPYVTYTVLGLCLVVHLLIQFSGFDNLNEAAILYGAYYKAFILAGEWWRFLTAGFVHVQVLHLFVNGMALSTLGSAMEKGLGHLKYCAVLFVSVIGGCAFLFAAQGNQVAVGISGGLYGLMAGYTYLIIKGGGWKNPVVKSALTRTYLINLLINFMPGVSVSGHIGGFLTGLFLTAVLSPGEKSTKFHYIAAAVLYCIFLGIFMSRSAYISQDQEYYMTDYRVLNAEKQMGFGAHAEKVAGRLDELYNNDGYLTEALKGG